MFGMWSNSQSVLFNSAVKATYVIMGHEDKQRTDKPRVKYNKEAQVSEVLKELKLLYINKLSPTGNRCFLFKNPKKTQLSALWTFVEFLLAYRQVFIKKRANGYCPLPAQHQTSDRRSCQLAGGHKGQKSFVLDFNGSKSHLVPALLKIRFASDVTLSHRLRSTSPSPENCWWGC